jgi:hypothetical protein
MSNIDDIDHITEEELKQYGENIVKALINQWGIFSDLAHEVKVGIDKAERIKRERNAFIASR